MTTPANQPDLIAFLRARYDEREQVATAAEDNDAARRWTASDDPWSGKVLDGNGDIVVYDEGSPSYGEAVHITRNDPAWVLADLDSKRRILDLHSPHELKATHYRPAMLQCEHCADLCHSRSGLSCEEPIDAPWPCPTVRLLALPFAGHPDYREEWRP